jgi:hypothetical protein
VVAGIIAGVGFTAALRAAINAGSTCGVMVSVLASDKGFSSGFVESLTSDSVVFAVDGKRKLPSSLESKAKKSPGATSD